MTLLLSNAARSVGLDAITDLIDAGTGQTEGYIEIRVGSAPAATTDADTGTLLATLPMSNPAFNAASNGVAAADIITSDSTADATGTAGYFRVKDRDGTVIMQGSCGTSGADLNLNTTSIVAGAIVSITSFQLTLPASA